VLSGYYRRIDRPGYWRDIVGHFDPSTKILDLGCGTGWVADYFADYTGLDISSSAVAEGRRQGRNVMLGDAGERLPFEDGRFDGVIAKDVLEHVPSPVQTVVEIRRVLAPGGLAYAVAPDAQRWAWEDYTHRRPFTRLALKRLFSEQGFGVVRAGWATTVHGSSVVSGWTRTNRRPLPLRALGYVPVVRRNCWVLAEAV
jgi:SAM-dependent methyltransferase